MRSVLIWMVVVNGVSCGCNDEPTQPAKQYAREPLQGGTFWIDRWGQGRLDTYKRFLPPFCAARQLNLPRRTFFSGCKKYGIT